MIVLTIALLLIYGFQGLNAAIPWNNETRAGEVLDLGDGATAVPPVGWQLEQGSLVGGQPAGNDAVLARGGTMMQLRVVRFSGTASAFLDQVQRSQGDDPARAEGPRGTLSTSGGLVGVVQSSTSPSGDKLQATFKLATGPADVVAAAPALLVEMGTAPGQFEQNQDVVIELLRSVTGVIQ